MPRLKLTATVYYEPDANDAYFEEPPEVVTKEHVRQMAEMDEENGVELLIQFIYDDAVEVKVEPAWDE